MTDAPIKGDPYEVQLERRWPGIDWQPVATFRDCEVPLGVLPEYRARQADQCWPVSCDTPAQRRAQLAAAILNAAGWQSAGVKGDETGEGREIEAVVGDIVEAVLPFMRGVGA